MPRKTTSSADTTRSRLPQLSPAQLSAYERDGYLAPVDVFPETEAASLGDRLKATERSLGRPLSGGERLKSHLLFAWIDELMRDERILAQVRQIIGPDILCWGTHMFIKEAEGPIFLTWHQDHIYWGLDNYNTLTAWVALSPSTRESGCVDVWPGSHRQTWRHVEIPDENNLLTRGQQIEHPIAESEAAALELRPGQMSLHNVRLAHRSRPNRSNYRRVGIAFRYIPTATRQTLVEWDSAALVSGEDRYGHFALEPRPSRDLDPVAAAFHAKTTDNQINKLFGGKGIKV
jgi:non-haem Fe2+, alpha-ketoglutarate-dependent halogenase